MRDTLAYNLTKKRISKKNVEGYLSKLDPSKLDPSKLKLSHKSGVVLKQTETIANARSTIAIATTPSFVDNGGPLIKNAKVQLIFPGSYWGAVPYPQPQTPDIAMSVANIVQTSQYMSELNQYRNVGNGVVEKWPSLLDINPPNPFTDKDVISIVIIALFRGLVPLPISVSDPSNLLYFVIMPPGVNYVPTNPITIGQHSFFDAPTFPPNSIHYAWVTNDTTLEGITRILSHELVEAATDPEGTSIVGTTGTCSGTDWCEIGDVCENQYGTLGVGGGGVSVQAYWSHFLNQ